MDRCELIQHHTIQNKNAFINQQHNNKVRLRRLKASVQSKGGKNSSSTKYTTLSLSGIHQISFGQNKFKINIRILEKGKLKQAKPFLVVNEDKRK